MSVDSNMLIGVFVAVILGATLYYLYQNDQQPIHNDGVVPRAGSLNNSSIQHPLQPQVYDNRRGDEISGDIVSNLVAQYTVEDRPMDGGMGSFSASDPMSDTHGSFSNYGQKRQLNMNKMEKPYSDDVYDARDYSYRLHRMRDQKGDGLHDSSDRDDNRDFTYKKRPYTRRTPGDVKDQFDSSKVLPVEIEEDWFDIEPLLTTKKIKDTHLLHPKVHMGVNTVGSSLRNGTHDLRGDIPNPKINVSPWLNSTIEPDTNIKGICSSI
jgi:hypothetical protein